MNRDATIGIIVVALLLGGIFLFARRPAAAAAPISAYAPRQLTGQGNIRFVPARAESPRYQNKEIRDTNLEYSSDGLLTKIRMEITRDYAIT